MKTVKIDNKEFEVIETRLKNVPYQFKRVNGTQVLRGIRNQFYPQTIFIFTTDKNMHKVDQIQESKIK